MGGEWKSGRLGDYVALRSGGTPSKTHAEFWSGTVPWISAKDMKSFWIEDSEDHLTQLGADGATCLVDPGTTLMLVRGMTLHSDIPICRVRRPSAFNQDVKAVLPRTGTDAEFLPYLLLGQKRRLLASVDSAGHGTGRLNTDTLLTLPVHMPAPDEQRAIACILGALDDKIELNRKMNQTLEGIARAIFKSWFADFDPVRAKAEGRDPGLPSHIADLFPSSFVDSELGQIPEGWRLAKYGEVLESKKERIGTNPAMEYSATTRGLEPRDDRFNKVLTQTPTRNKRIEKNDLVFGLSRRVVNFGLMTAAVGSVSPVYEVYSIDGTKYVPEILEMYIRHHMAAHMDILRPGAREGQPIDGRYLLSKHVLVPDPRVQREFESLVLRPTARRIEHIERKTSILASVRDTLLPRLISGELRVPNAERIVGRCV